MFGRQPISPADALFHPLVGVQFYLSLQLSQIVNRVVYGQTNGYSSRENRHAVQRDAEPTHDPKYCSHRRDVGQQAYQSEERRLHLKHHQDRDDRSREKHGLDLIANKLRSLMRHDNKIAGNRGLCNTLHDRVGGGTNPFNGLLNRHRGGIPDTD